MQLVALTEGGKRVAALTGDNRSIAEFSLEDYMVIEVCMGMITSRDVFPCFHVLH
jgi:hypothetical protein